MGGSTGLLVLPIERCLRTLRKNFRNKAKIEVSIASAYIMEVSNFTTTYYAENLPSVHNPSPRYNVVENESNLSLCRGQLDAQVHRPLRLSPITERQTQDVFQVLGHG